jgi:glycosyltransferase involved in cell wall biosynthesis
MKLSILMPAYNEARTIEVAVKRVLGVAYPVDFELVIVNDGSSDGTLEALATIADSRVRVISHERNRGKGAAIRSAAEAASGDYMIICDADLEYSPEEIPALLAPVIAGEAEVVYGTRTFGSHSSFSFWYVMGNKLVTMFANVLFNCYISDLETCFKLMPLELYRRLDIKSAGFGMEAEATSKLLRMGYRPYEIPISYRARGREQGKKITAWDGIEALWIIARTRVAPRRPAAKTK